MQFYFIRHAQSQNNARYYETGSSQGRSEDPDLSPTGYEQAPYLARFLRQSAPARSRAVPDWNPQNVSGFGITHLYCSLMLRAVATGTIVGQALDLPLVAWEELHEVGGIVHYDDETGERTPLPGRNRAFFEARYPDLILPEGLGEEGWWSRPYEEREQRPHRARRFLHNLLDKHGDSDHRVAVISHGAFFSYLMHAILELPGTPPPWFHMGNTAITRIDFSEERIGISYMNNAVHLPRDLIT
jgi:2,3-bisphosphoglycerate-dependent phosphoglycerate mutase